MTAIPATIIENNGLLKISAIILILSFSTLAFKKLKIVIHTKVLNKKVKCLEGPTNSKIGK